MVSRLRPKVPRRTLIDRLRQHQAALLVFAMVFVGGSVATNWQRIAANIPVYYANCGAARMAGAAPLTRGAPGYRESLDADGDGIACEPYRDGGSDFRWRGRRFRY